MAAQVPVIGYLGPGPLDARIRSPVVEAFRQGLRDQGLVEGQNVIINYGFTAGRDDLYPGLANQMVAAGVKLIAAIVTPAALAARDATLAGPRDLATGRPISVVVVQAADPVGAGLAESLVRPGTNVTGLAHNSPASIGYRLSLLLQTVPGATRIAALYNPSNPSKLTELQSLRAAAALNGVQLLEHPAQNLPELTTELLRIDADALLLLQESFAVANRKTIINHVQQRSRALPALYVGRIFVDDGGLMSYGSDRYAAMRRGAAFVARILNGADPATLPFEVQRPELILNQRAAAAINFVFPATVVSQADQVIR